MLSTELVGRALDAAVHRIVFGGCPHDMPRYSLDGIVCRRCGAEAEALSGPPRYSTDLRTSWLVVTAMAGRGFDVALRSESGAGDAAAWQAEFSIAARGGGAAANGRTAPEALCRAAIVAVASIR